MESSIYPRKRFAFSDGIYEMVVACGNGSRQTQGLIQRKSRAIMKGNHNGYFYINTVSHHADLFFLTYLLGLNSSDPSLQLNYFS